MDDSPIIYGLEDFQARALVAHAGETEKINFLVGTQSLRNTNQVQLIEFDDDTCLVSKQVFDHTHGEIWALACAPFDPYIFSSIYNGGDFGNIFKAAIWKMPMHLSSNHIEDQTRVVELLCHLNTNDTAGSSCESSDMLLSKENSAVDIVWEPERTKKIVALSERTLFLYDIQESETKCKASSKTNLNGKSSEKFFKGRWYPHMHGNSFAATHGNGIECWDLRSMESTWHVQNAHSQLVRGFDFNPNKQYFMATCGDDCKTCFWDIRNISEPVMAREDHSHWVWNVRYNCSYDQLILTCSSDHRVILLNLPSIASQPFGTLDEQDTEAGCSDRCAEGIAHTYDDHEDSVYAVEWSSADFWTFASLSYDGRLVIHRVPRNIKYKQFM